MFCPKCGYENKDDADSCTSCATLLTQREKLATQPHIVVIQQPKSSGIAAVLSFFWCGLGQIYNGQIGKGIIFLIVYGISWMLMFVIIGFVTTPILWIWGMIDAYQTAERVNQAVKNSSGATLFN